MLAAPPPPEPSLALLELRPTTSAGRNNGIGYNYVWSCCQCGHGVMNTFTTPQCVSCFFHERCKACHVEVHEVRNDGACSPLVMRSSKIYGGSEIEGRVKTAELADKVTTPALEFEVDIQSYMRHSHSITAVMAPSQLDILQDLSLSESKIQSQLRPVTGISSTYGQPTLSMISPGSSTSSKQDEKEQPSSGDPTPASEAWEYWEESPELRGYNIDGETLLEALRGPLSVLFQEWVRGIYCHHGTGDASSSSPSSSAHRLSGHEQPESKRKRVDDADNEEPDPRPNKLRVTEKRSRKLNPLHKSLACPYFKKDSRRHRSCCGFGFTKISYMKAHIYRKHAIPIYCPVCQQSFEDVQQRDSHSRERNCEPVENGQTQDGITSEQRDWLHQRGPRNFSEEEHWFRIFDFLFPGHPRPRSPYNDTAFSEDLLDFRDFVSGPTAQDILLEGVRQNPIWTPEMEAIIRPDLAQGLDQLYWRWAGTEDREAGRRPAIVSPSQDPGTSSAQSTNEGAIVLVPLPATSLSESSDLSAAESPTLEASRGATSGDATSATVQQLQEEQEPPLEFELEERKVDEGDQLSPRQLTHDGISLVPDQGQWPPASFPEHEDTGHDPYAFTDDMNYETFAAGYAFSNPLDEIGSADDWMSTFELPGNEATLPLLGEEDSHTDESLVNLVVKETGEETGMSGAKCVISGQINDSIILDRPS